MQYVVIVISPCFTTSDYMSDGILLSEEFHQSCHTFTDGILPLRISISQMTDAFSTSRISISHGTEPFLEMLLHLKKQNNLGQNIESNLR